MQQLFYGVSRSFKAFTPEEDVIEVLEQDLVAYEESYANMMVEMAKNLMYCQQFAELELNDKVFFNFILNPKFSYCYTNTSEHRCIT